jgi:hypothetical protein
LNIRTTKPLARRLLYRNEQSGAKTPSLRLFKYLRCPAVKIKSIDLIFDSAGEELPALRRKAFYLATENVKFRHATETLQQHPVYAWSDLTGGGIAETKYW